MRFLDFSIVLSSASWCFSLTWECSLKQYRCISEIGWQMVRLGSRLGRYNISLPFESQKLLVLLPSLCRSSVLTWAWWISTAKNLCLILKSSKWSLSVWMIKKTSPGYPFNHSSDSLFPLVLSPPFHGGASHVIDISLCLMILTKLTEILANSWDPHSTSFFVLSFFRLFCQVLANTLCKTAARERDFSARRQDGSTDDDRCVCRSTCCSKILPKDPDYHFHKYVFNDVGSCVQESGDFHAESIKKYIRNQFFSCLLHL